MKYVRTKDGRILKVRLTYIDCSANYSKAYWSEQGEPFIEERKDFMIADTIEGLCDRFIVLYNKCQRNDESILKSFTSVKIRFSRDKRYKLQHIKDIFGAVFTDKGLIYVAKMNEKGELELL